MASKAENITLVAGDRVYFMGIGGTGMASVAGLAQQAGFDVIGSDMNLYPPMSTMLEALKIPVLSPYSPENIVKSKSKIVVVANALSRNHIELEAMLASDMKYTSFPAFLGEYFLEKRSTIVVAGTHGKTTTSSLMAHTLVQLGLKPGYLIGGIPRTLPNSFDLGKDGLFVIEGDEYDTAFFDKHSKFLHYRPKFLILNNIEFDHADIFPNLEAIEAEFAELLKLLPNPKSIIANTDDPGVVKLLNQLNLLDKVTRVATQGKDTEAAVRLLALNPPSAQDDGFWTLNVIIKELGQITLKTTLAGPHNAANTCQVLACLWQLFQNKQLPNFDVDSVVAAIKSFTGVKRRLDKLASVSGVDIYEDFAHHPTAVKTVIESMRKLYPSNRLLVAFEPKNATSRRNVFLKDFASSLSLADGVFIGPCPVDLRIPPEKRMDTSEMAKLIGDKARVFQDNEALLDSLVGIAKPRDTILFMSSGSFSGIQYRLGERLSHIEK